MKKLLEGRQAGEQMEEIDSDLESVTSLCDSAFWLFDS